MTQRLSEHGEWTEVDPQEGLEEGDLIRTYHCVQAPELLRNEIFANLSVEIGKLTGEINNQTPDCMETEVQNTELVDGSGIVVDGDECEFIYITTMKITSLEGDCRQYTYASFAQFVVAALAVVAVLVGISLVFWRAEKFLQSPGGKETGKNVSLALLLLAGGWAFKQFAGEGDGEGLLQPTDDTGDD